MSFREFINDGSRVLATGGTISSLLSMVGGFVTPSCSRLGPALVRCAGLVILMANVFVVVRGRSR